MFLSSAAFLFQNPLFLENSFTNNIRVSNRLDLDQERYFVVPDMGPNLVQRLSSDDTSRQRVMPSLLYCRSLQVSLPCVYIVLVKALFNPSMPYASQHWDRGIQ